MKTAHEAIAAIRAEIERRMTECHEHIHDRSSGYAWEAQFYAYKGILAFLDTLEAEKKDAFCKENCKGYQDTGRCFCDGGCEAKKKAGEKEVDLDGPTIAEEIRRLGPNPSEYDVALHFYDLCQKSRPKESKDLDFQTFAKEMDELWSLPSEETKNDEDNPLRWEYAIARHFYELGQCKK